MSGAAEQINPVIERLGQVMDQGNLPPPYDRWGARLLAHLTKPVRVVVTGFEGSGKTALIEMMAGRSVLGRALNVPMVEIVYGDTEQAIIERADGSVSAAAGYLKDRKCPDDAVRVRQELPDLRLIQQDYIEIGLRGTLAQKRATLETAISHADLMVWCSQDFSEEEQQLWSIVPDPIKDHSMLALTMADQQLMRGVLTTTIARLEPVVAEEFLGLFPVATLQGITAQTCADTVNTELWNSSGGQHLMELIARQVRQGRKADVDQARIFMDRLAMRLPQIKAGLRDVSQETEPKATMPMTAPPTQPEPVQTDATEPATVSDASAIAVLSEAVDLLQQQAVQMLQEMNETDEVDPDRILNGCAEAMSSVSSLLGSTERSDPAAGAMKDDVQEGEEMLMLFQLERGEEAALDAVTLMLQIRKELIDKLAV